MRRILSLICLSLAACAPQPVDVAATINAGVALTDTALASAPTPAGTPTPTPRATSTRLPSPTPRSAPTPTRLPNAVDLAFDEKASYGPRQENWIYAFVGAEGDNVTVTVELSNAHPNLNVCRNFKAAADFALKTNGWKALKPRSQGAGPLQQIYRLPYSGTYYVEVSCSGTYCNAYCAQVDTSLQLNR